jgi:L-cysteine desulfidase
VISKTVVNTLANISGMLCDGAKSSCAIKIASAVDAANMAYNLAKSGIIFNPGDGLVKGNAEKTIASICRLAKEGMQETDKKILEIMIESSH